jgi:hypothetical protein
VPAAVSVNILPPFIGMLPWNDDVLPSAVQAEPGEADHVILSGRPTVAALLLADIVATMVATPESAT